MKNEKHKDDVQFFFVCHKVLPGIHRHFFSIFFFYKKILMNLLYFTCLPPFYLWMFQFIFPVPRIRFFFCNKTFFLKIHLIIEFVCIFTGMECACVSFETRRRNKNPRDNFVWFHNLPDWSTDTQIKWEGHISNNLYTTWAQMTFGPIISLSGQ